MSRTTKRYRTTALAVLGIVVLAGCEDLPAGPESEVATVSGETDPATAAAVEEAWELLPSAEEVQLLALDAIESAAPDADVEARLLEAGELDVEASAALDGGDVGAAETYLAWSEDAYFDAAVAALGVGYAGEVVESVETAADRIEGARIRAHRSQRARQSLERARARIRAARDAIDRGDHALGLQLGLEAADELRGLDPEARARQLVEKAFQLLDRAEALAGDDPRPEIAEILREAREHCEAARRALDAGNWELAVREARRCATLARRVIVLLSGGVSDDTLAERAAALVEDAQQLYSRAAELAGDDPDPEIARALGEARDHLSDAERALEAEEWRDAIRLARTSAAISGRVIAQLSGVDRPDGLQARAEQAVAHAQDLLERADALAGDDPRPEIETLLSRARSLIAEAESALESEDWREALFKARQAAVTLQRVIFLLTARG